MQTYSPLMKSIAATLLITFTMLILEPTALAVQSLDDGQETETANIAPAPQPDLLKHIGAQLKQLQQRPQRRSFQPIDTTPIRQAVDEYNAQAQTNAEAILPLLQAPNLPPEILERHQRALQEYAQQHSILLNNLDAIDQAQSPDAQNQAINQTVDHLAPLLDIGGHAPFDPEQLPFNIPDGNIRAPKDSQEDLKELAPADPVQVASLNLVPGLLAYADAPNDTDLAETVDVQISEDIQQLAASLDHHPIKIYNWVHDNIKYIPTYGSIQGSQMTLDNKAGNAFDTTSLLIALLRASGIHARYAYGTVRMPIEKVMNWVGGVTDPNAAIQLLAQGGIPVIAQTQGGVITHAKLEHIWVEAWVDFYPSRGAINKQGDAWAPMDASFKQYEYTQGMDLQNNVNFDAEAFAQHITDTASINETEGSVQNIDHTYIQNQLQSYQSQIEQYIQQTNADATVGDVLGTQNIIPANRIQLAASLPYTLHQRGNQFAILPDNMRHHFSFTLYRSAQAQTFDNPEFSYRSSLPALAGKRLTFSFSPASEADQQFIESFIPEVQAGEELNPADLPTSLPGYLIHLNAEFKVDGEVVKSASGFRMGQELHTTTAISRVTGGEYQAKNKPIAGEFYAIGVDLQGINANQLETVKTRLESTKTQLENQDIAGLTKDGLIGDMLYAAALSYFSANDFNLNLLNKMGPVTSYRLPSFGTFSTNLQPVYRFGIPQQVDMSGILVDMDVVAQSLWADDNNPEISKAVGQQVGIMTSALEHQIPELFFTNEDNPGEAVSAVKALSIAAQQGQKIYQVTQANVDTVLPQLNIGQGVKDEIVASVAVGKEVTVSENNITVAGWVGVGYIISDPETGAGAYRISGGANGAELTADGLRNMRAMTLSGMLNGLKEFFNIILPYTDAFIKRLGAGVAITIYSIFKLLVGSCTGDALIALLALNLIMGVFLTIITFLLISSGVGATILALTGAVFMETQRRINEKIENEFCSETE